MERVGALLAVNLQADDDELLDFAVAEFNRAAWTLARAGVAFAELKHRLPHGKFEEAIEKRGISSQRASEAIRVAELIAKMPEDQARRLAALPKSKAIELAKAEPEVIEELLEEGALDGKEPLSVRELRERLQEHEQRELRLTNQIHIHELEIADYKRQLEDRAKTRKDPVWHSILRGEVMPLGEEMFVSFKAIEKAVNEFLLPAPFSTADEKMWVRLGASTVYHTLGGIAAMSQRLCKELVEQFGDEILEDEYIKGAKTLDKELERQIATHDRITRRVEIEQGRRALAREIDKPRGRGRPKGSKNKKR